MASLLERMSLPSDADRNLRHPALLKRKRDRAASGPYDRSKRPSKRDESPAPAERNVDGQWKHDLFETPSLIARLTDRDVGPPKVNFGYAEKALKQAYVTSTKTVGGLAIKGASTRGNVVRVAGLAPDTSAADVKVFFEQIGPISSVELDLESLPVNPIMRVTYKKDEHAKAAVDQFDGQTADGRTLRVNIVGTKNATLTARIGAASITGSVDALMPDVDMLLEGGEKSGSKFRSDSMVHDPRAHVLVAPPGADPKEYTERAARAGRGRGARRGRGRGRGGRKGGEGKAS